MTRQLSVWTGLKTPHSEKSMANGRWVFCKPPPGSEFELGFRGYLCVGKSLPNQFGEIRLKAIKEIFQPYFVNWPIPQVQARSLGQWIQLLFELNYKTISRLRMVGNCHLRDGWGRYQQQTSRLYACAKIWTGAAHGEIFTRRQNSYSRCNE